MVRIRLALDSDPAAIARAQVAAWHEAYAGLIPAAYLADYTVAMRTERWERILRAPLPGGVTLVGEVGGVVEGFVSIADSLLRAPRVAPGREPEGGRFRRRGRGRGAAGAGPGRVSRRTARS